MGKYSFHVGATSLFISNLHNKYLIKSSESLEIMLTWSYHPGFKISLLTDVIFKRLHQELNM